MKWFQVVMVVNGFAAGLTGMVALRTLQQREDPGARWFGIAMGAVSAWALLAAVSKVPVIWWDSTLVTIFWRLEYTPTGVLTVAWFGFCLSYTGRESLLTRGRVLLLSLVPAVTAVAALCHPFFIPTYAELLGPFGGVAELLWAVESVWDELFWLGTGYTYFLLFLGSVFLLEVLVERPVPHVGQALVLLIVVPPWVLNALHLSGVLTFSAFDPTILGFTVTGIAGLAAVGRFRLFDVPMARARLVEDIDIGVLVYGRGGRVYDYNERAASLLELDPTVLETDVRTALADSPLDLPPDVALSSGGTGDSTGVAPGGRDDPPERWEPENQEPILDGGVATFESHLDGTTFAVERNGEQSYVETRVSPVAETSGRQSRVIHLYDVTQRERNRREIERSRERYRTLFENNQLVLWEFDLSVARERAAELAAESDDLAAFLASHPDKEQWVFEGVNVTDVNEKAVEVYGAESTAQLRENSGALLTDDAMAAWREIVATIVAGETSLRKEFGIQRFDGEQRVMLTEMNVPDGHAEEYDRVYMTALDITARKERERRLERKNEFLDEFASVVSHDVATPLNVIENKAQLVEMTGDPSHTGDIYDAVEQIERLIDELRDLAREGKQVGETEPVDLETVTEEAWRTVETPRATLEVAAPGTLEADRDRLGQLLANLLANAVEHGAPDGSAVTVEVGTLQNGFYVADDGSGIPETNHDEVFEQGFTTEEENTGLGLAIVARIADGHGWDVTVTESYAGGARFEFRTDD